jgi:probable rRNA maturation factor
VPTFVTRNGKGAPSLDRRGVRARAERMLEELGVSERELSILLTDDAHIEALNRKHRRKAKPTDVLAFPMDSDQGPHGSSRLLGDVVVSLDTALRQARARRRPLIDEVTHLLAHGLLHLLGYDHRTDAEERRMNALVDRLVRVAVPRQRRVSNLVERSKRSRLTSRAR